MLERKRRLNKNRYFQYMYKKGEKINSSNMYLVYLKTKFKPNRFGFVVSNKIGKAVKRNLVKRRLRAIVQEMLNIIDPTFNFIVVAKESIRELDYPQIKKEVYSLFKKGKFLNESNSKNS